MLVIKFWLNICHKGILKIINDCEKSYCAQHAQRYISELSPLYFFEEGQLYQGGRLWFFDFVALSLISGAKESTLKCQVVQRLKNWYCEISHFVSHSCAFNSANISLLWRETLLTQKVQENVLNYSWRKKELTENRK